MSVTDEQLIDDAVNRLVSRLADKQSLLAFAPLVTDESAIALITEHLGLDESHSENVGDRLFFAFADRVMRSKHARNFQQAVTEVAGDLARADGCWQ